MSLNTWVHPAKAAVHKRGEEEGEGRVEWLISDRRRVAVSPAVMCGLETVPLKRKGRGLL